MPVCASYSFPHRATHLSGASVKDLTLVRGRGLLISCAFQSEIFVWDYMRGTVLQRIEHDAQVRGRFRDAWLRVVMASNEMTQLRIFETVSLYLIRY